VGVTVDIKRERKMSNDEIMNSLNLSPAQKRVLVLIMKGLSNEDVAEELYYATKTVKFHASDIYKKTGLSTRFRLMAGLAKMGWYFDNTVRLPVAKPVYDKIPKLQVGSSKWV
jgi:DNA-binding NarL/FixJ family response regulator